jgi:hypothetical protein
LGLLALTAAAGEPADAKLSTRSTETVVTTEVGVAPVITAGGAAAARRSKAEVLYKPPSSSSTLL